MTHRARIGSIAAAFSLAAGMAIPLSATPAAGQGSSDGEAVRADEVHTAFQPCPANTEGVEVVLALDQSGSLTVEDPGGRDRRRAIEAVRQFTEILGEDADFNIDLALLSFDTEARLHAGFERISRSHPSDEDIAAAIADGVGDTDYRKALEAALEQFENSSRSGDRNTCRILFFFTDGILDPFNTVARLGHVSAADQRVAAAEAHAEELIRDACLAPASYKNRLKDLDVRTIAVLWGESFRRRDNSHQGSMTIKSLQLFLALTADETSELIRDIAYHPACEQWASGEAASDSGASGSGGDSGASDSGSGGDSGDSGSSGSGGDSGASDSGSGGDSGDSGSSGSGGDSGASGSSGEGQPGAGEPDGQVITLDDIDGLVEAIEEVGEELDLVKRQPRLDCRPVPSESEIVGDWPGFAIARDICTVDAPEDGRAYVSVSEIADDAGEVDWGLSSGLSAAEPGGEARVEVEPGDGELDLHAVSTLFPGDRLSRSSRATLVVSIEWRPESDQSDVRAIHSPPIEIEYDRDAAFQPDLTCKDWVQASVDRDELPGSVVADEVCEVSSKGAGETSLVVVGDRLDWEPVPCQNGDCSTSSLRADLTDGLTYTPFEDEVRVGLQWRSPSGALLWSGADEDGQAADRDDLEDVVIEIDLSQVEPPHLDCSDDPPEVAGSGGEVPEEPVRVDTGCILRPPTGGQVTVEIVEGDSSAGDIAWALPDGAVTLGPGDDEVPLIVVSKGPLPNMRFDDSVDLKLRAEWQAPGIEQGERVEEELISFHLDFKARSNNLLALLLALLALLLAAVLTWLVWYWLLTRKDRLPDADRLFAWKQRFSTTTDDASGRVDAPDLRNWRSWNPESRRVVRGANGKSLKLEDLEIQADKPSFFDIRGLTSGDRAARLSVGRSGWIVEAWPPGRRAGSLPVAFQRGAVVMGLNASGPTADGAVWVIFNRGDDWRDLVRDAKMEGMFRSLADRLGRPEEKDMGEEALPPPRRPSGPPPRPERPRRPS